MSLPEQHVEMSGLLHKKFIRWLMLCSPTYRIKQTTTLVVH